MPNLDKNEHNKYLKFYQRARYKERKEKLTALLGGVCVVCGTIERLEFDHIDPETKEFTICKRLNGASWEDILEEAKKCQLLCRKCHNRKTHGKKV